MTADTAQFVDHPDHVGLERVVDFDSYAPPGVDRDFHPAWNSLNAPGLPDLPWTPRNGGHWIPTRAAIIAEVMSDFELFSNRAIMIPKELGAEHGLIPATHDPPEHRPYRNILNDNLARPSVVRIESQVREFARELTAQVRPRGQCDFTTDYAELETNGFVLLASKP